MMTTCHEAITNRTQAQPVFQVSMSQATIRTSLFSQNMVVQVLYTRREEKRLN